MLTLARQPYYRWLIHPIGSRELDDAYLANAVFDAYRDDPEFGYRLLADQTREAGHARCDRTVWRICAANRWWSVFGKPRGRNGKRPGPPAHDDLVKRDFTAQGPNQLWLTDITEHWTGQEPNLSPEGAAVPSDRPRRHRGGCGVVDTAPPPSTTARSGAGSLTVARTPSRSWPVDQVVMRGLSVRSWRRGRAR